MFLKNQHKVFDSGLYVISQDSTQVILSITGSTVNNIDTERRKYQDEQLKINHRGLLCKQPYNLLLCNSLTYLITVTSLEASF